MWAGKDGNGLSGGRYRICCNSQESDTFLLRYDAIRRDMNVRALHGGGRWCMSCILL